MERLVVEGERVAITRHAAARWHERCRPALTVAAALDDLRTVVAAAARWDDHPPTWLNGEADPEAAEATTWIYIGDDVVMPVVWDRGRGGFVALSCLTRGSISDTARRERRQRRRAGARARKMTGFATQTGRNARGAGSRKRHGEKA